MSQKTLNKYIGKARRLLARLQAEANFKGIYENFGQKEIRDFSNYVGMQDDDLTYLELSKLSDVLNKVSDIVPTRMNPSGGLPIEFRLYTYDVWGNEKDGYEVNDVSRTSETYKLFKDYTDREILEALQEQGAIPKAGISLKLIEIEGDFDTSLAFYYNGRPEFELRPE